MALAASAGRRRLRSWRRPTWRCWARPCDRPVADCDTASHVHDQRQRRGRPITAVNETPTGPADDAERLRHALVDQINSWQPLSKPVADAMRTVERHRFVPDTSLKEAYTDDTVVTRRDDDGLPTSSASAPWLVGRMLDQLQLGHGMRVLEIGAGTGYNAALLAELVASSGHVTAVEITPDVADDARKALAVVGVANAEVICGDGEYGHPPNAPYERIIATAGAWEIPDAWADQLTPDGVLVAPLRIRGLTRSVALTRDESGVWRSSSLVNCGFMPIRGHGAMPERNIHIAEDVVVRFDDGQDVDADALARAAGPGDVAWSGVLIDRPLDLLDFYLADLDGFCRVLAPPSIAERGLAEPVNGWGSMGVATEEALGYLTKRTSPDNPYLYELGVCAYGPGAAAILDNIAERVHRWSRARTSVTGVRIEIHPPEQGDTADALMTLDKRHSRVVVRPEHEPGSQAPLTPDER